MPHFIISGDILGFISIISTLILYFSISISIYTIYILSLLKVAVPCPYALTLEAQVENLKDIPPCVNIR
jgi:hypothetical protein